MKTRLILLITMLFFGSRPEHLTAQTQDRFAVMQTIGVQGGALVYHTYYLIDDMHNGFVNDGWDKEVVLTVLNDQSILMIRVAAEYDTLLASGQLASSDSAAVIQLRDCCLLLKKEADDLAGYVNDANTENHDQYLNARTDAWEMIANLFGFNSQSFWGGSQRAEEGTK